MLESAMFHLWALRHCSRERATIHESLIKTNDLRGSVVSSVALSSHVTSSRTARGHRGRMWKWRWSANGRRYICTEMHVDVHLELKQQKPCVVVIVPCRATLRWQVVWFIAGYMFPEKVSSVTLMRFHSSTVKKETSFTADTIVLSFWGEKNYYLLCICCRGPQYSSFTKHM